MKQTNTLSEPCIFCDILDHRPWEPASFVYEDEEIAVFHNVLGWIPVMLLAVPKRRLLSARNGGERHYEQRDLWRNMGRLGQVAVEMGKTHCTIDGQAQFRLVCNVGSLALQTQRHAHLHVLGTRFEARYPDLRSPDRLIHEDQDLLAYRDQIDSSLERRRVTAMMVVPRAPLTQDEFFARMDEFGPTILDLAGEHVGESYRLLAEFGSHAPVPENGAHVFILGGAWLGHYV